MTNVCSNGRLSKFFVSSTKGIQYLFTNSHFPAASSVASESRCLNHSAQGRCHSTWKHRPKRFKCISIQRKTSKFGQRKNKSKIYFRIVFRCVSSANVTKVNWKANNFCAKWNFENSNKNRTSKVIFSVSFFLLFADFYEHVIKLSNCFVFFGILYIRMTDKTRNGK